MIKGSFSILFLIFFFTASAQYKDNSVLSKGDWYKIGVTSDGIYKIDYAYLKKIGISIDKADVKQIQIFGNGGGMLPQANSSIRIDDLAECPIFISGAEDGKFNNGDFLVFYAQGPDKWNYDKVNKTFTHLKNLYADTAYYFITVGQGDRKEISSIPSETQQGTIIQSFNEHMFHENDLVNLIKSGREWYGEQFNSNTSQTISFNSQGIISGSDIGIDVALMVKAGNSSQTYFNANLNNYGLSKITSNICSCSDLGFHGVNTYASYNINTSKLTNTENLSLTLQYNNSSDLSAIGYLNYVDVFFDRNLSLYGSQTSFRSIESASQSIASFSVANTTSNTLIWDISDIHSINSIQFSGNNPSTFSIKTDSLLKEFVVFDPILVSQAPLFVGKTQNQNLHMLTSDSDVLIITSPSLIDQANRLANFRNDNGVKATVVTVSQIYNEFSSGAQDISAIRDFCRLSLSKGKLKNVLLFGSCSYDYKNRIKNNTNLVPVYETRESLHTIDSFSSDDYFGLLSNNQGEWPENSVDTSHLALGIGRLPVRNNDEAILVVDKLVHYSSERPSLGKWRNKIAFIADNGDGNSHLSEANDMADDIDKKDSTLNINKIYVDAYPLVSTPAGNTSPETNQAIRDVVNQGSLIINYNGHGGPEQIAQEKILNTGDISLWNNFDKLPFLVTATCDFGVYDNPDILSGGQALILSEKSGGIGVITAGRPVFQSSNTSINNAFYDFVFKTGPTGEMPTLGDIIRKTKNNSIRGINNRGYALLGDPSMTLNYPKYTLAVTSVNTGEQSSLNDTLKALSVISIEGEVRDNNNVVVADFNGGLYSDVYDKYSIINTLGQVSDTPPVTFKLRNSTIQSGKSSITNGRFAFKFVVPKDINYQYDKGKISLYAFQNNSMEDAAGFNMNLVIGGTSANAEEDNTSPVINLYMDDTTFINGGYTSNSPMLVARLSDAHGINIARSGIGHEITGKTSIDPLKTFILNDFYTSDLDTYKKGTVAYKLSDLPEGTHTFTLKAWDTYNNSSESTVSFIVAGSSKIKIQSLLNVPNPITPSFLLPKFQIQHNRAGEDIEVNLMVYSLEGRILKEFNETIIASSATINIAWDTFATDNNIIPGMYVYCCTLKSKKDGTSDKAYQKLVLIH